MFCCIWAKQLIRLALLELKNFDYHTSLCEMRSSKAGSVKCFQFLFTLTRSVSDPVVLSLMTHIAIHAQKLLYNAEGFFLYSRVLSGPGAKAIRVFGSPHTHQCRTVPELWSFAPFSFLRLCGPAQHIFRTSCLARRS